MQALVLFMNAVVMISLKENVIVMAIYWIVQMFVEGML